LDKVSSWWSRLGLRLKLQILIQGLMIAILGVALLWVSARFERQVLAAAEARAMEVADGAINGLNTLMLIKAGDRDVISDKASRAKFIKMMGVSEKLKEMRVVRGKAIDDEFPAGLPEEQPVDELDRSVLASGKTVTRVVQGAQGEAALRLVTPFIATKNFRGNNCLQCHAVDEGAIVGAASIVIDVKDDLASIARMKVWLWAGFIGLQLISAAMLYVIAGSVVRRLGGEPEVAADMAGSVARGDLSVALQVPAGDTTSLMARLQEMQTGLARVVADVRCNAEAVAVASAQIAKGNSDLASRTEMQASALQQTAASMEQLSASVRQNAEHARQADRLANDSCAVAVTGGEVVGGVVATMKSISDSSRRIASIIGVIDEIAFRTNILALNAAVEAARAGEQGRGFAVVAAEVRSLAQRSAAAAGEIKGLIRDSVERVEEGSALVDRAGATMDEIVQSIRRVTGIMAEISSASAEQSAGVAQIGEAVSHMDRVTQQNAALVEESAAASASLKGQAQQLVDAVAVFRLRDRPATGSAG